MAAVKDQAYRRFTIDYDVATQIREIAAERKQMPVKVLNELVLKGIAYEKLPPPPADTPLERRVRVLLSEDDNLTRNAAVRIAEAGGHGAV